MANIQDVAKRAQVSIATVSRVLNGTAYVNKEVRVRVQEAVEELHYRPSRAARALRGNHSSIIGLLITDVQNPFFTPLVRGVEDVVQSKGYSLILCNSDESLCKEQKYIEALCAEHVAGAIVVPTCEQQSTVLPFRERNIPVVVVDHHLKDEASDVILVDHAGGAREAVLHLIENGYRRIGIISGPKTRIPWRERLGGYREALRAANLPVDPLLERDGPFDVDIGRQLARELLSLEEPIDALFVANNLMTIGALEAIHERNMRVPDDIAIVGFGEVPGAALGGISLTTVAQPVYELGAAAASRLFLRLQAPEAYTQQEIVLTPTLCVRGSSSPKGQIYSGPF